MEIVMLMTEPCVTTLSLTQDKRGPFVIDIKYGYIITNIEREVHLLVDNSYRHLGNLKPIMFMDIVMFMSGAMSHIANRTIEVYLLVDNSY